MRNINVTLEESEYKKIMKAKEVHGGNWHDFFLDLARQYYLENLNGKKKKEK